jgi:hypothetical protein
VLIRAFILIEVEADNWLRFGFVIAAKAGMTATSEND